MIVLKDSHVSFQDQTPVIEAQLKRNKSSLARADQLVQMANRVLSSSARTWYLVTEDI